MEKFEFDSGIDGPALVVTGAVHGDERAGPDSIGSFLENWDRILKKGRVTFVPVVNEAARAQNTRFVDVDLNRCMGAEELGELSEHKIVPEVRALLEAHDVLLDLHSFRKGDGAFALLGPKDNSGGLEPFSHEIAETAFGASVGIKRVLHGWLGSYNCALSAFNASNGKTDDPFPALEKSVGMTEYMRNAGGYACTVECGQHEAEDCISNGVSAIEGALVGLGMIEGEIPKVEGGFDCYELYQVIIKSHEDDGLINDTIENFDVLPKGEPILKVGGKDFSLDQDGVIAMFPKASPQIGESIITLARPSKRLDNV
ncbi:succinylglutamate desuccinylase/aspartoacylase family protein [Hirschia maritima]|uniref:succinylglutamate desuccinylase/aspartoacylase family protein n=1 Tax=Hirschia maritima TaxID=1121961 RepID=UPI00037E7ECD|nr:succinylglutamate desuccinylase/aspartoacylase family protein [Hirschia maritima]